MPENPLLPHRKLKELYALMSRLHDKSRGSKDSASRGIEALLAGVQIQLEEGDVFCGDRETLAALILDNSGTTRVRQTAAQAAIFASSPRESDLATVCETLARGLKAADREGAAVCAVRSSSSAEWSATLEKAQAERLPIVLIIADQQQGPDKKASPFLTWPFLSRIAKKLQLSTISVDGDDAVAIYRVVQESLHRAKHGDGPALIWCAYPSGPESRKGSRSLANMESYLAIRGLLPRSGSAAVKAVESKAAH